MVKQNNRFLSWHIFPTTWVSLLLFLLIFPLGLTLPVWWGWENGPLENTQVVILGIGAIISRIAMQHHRYNRKYRRLWSWLILFWLILMGRELSWGRVFYPVAIGADGPHFISIQQLWYGPLVRPVVTIAILAMLIGILRTSPWKYVQQTTLPLTDIVILLISSIVAMIFDKISLQGEVVEEWAELTAYWSMVSITVVTGLKNQNKGKIQRKICEKYIPIKKS